MINWILRALGYVPEADRVEACVIQNRDLDHEVHKHLKDPERRLTHREKVLVFLNRPFDSALTKEYLDTVTVTPDYTAKPADTAARLRAMVQGIK